jgi:hypothetical protein
MALKRPIGARLSGSLAKKREFLWTQTVKDLIEVLFEMKDKQIFSFPSF